MSDQRAVVAHLISFAIVGAALWAVSGSLIAGVWAMVMKVAL